jgi:hypothetical protein
MPREHDTPRERAGQDERALHRDMPSVTNRSFEPVPAGDGFGYPGQGGYGERVQARGHRGVPPRDTWLSDARLQELLHQRLTDDEGVDATAVLVAVTDGVATLNGHVPTRRMKHAVEELAWGCGAREVDNRLHIGGDAGDLPDPGEAIRSGRDQQGSGFSSSTRTEFSDRKLGTEGAHGTPDIPLRDDEA